MDLQMLSNLFATTFNPDPNIRKSAELEIRKVSFHYPEYPLGERFSLITPCPGGQPGWHGHCPSPDYRRRQHRPVRVPTRSSSLFWFTVALYCSATRQACAVWVKNRVFTHYSTEIKGGISQTDREALRANLLHLIAAAPSRSIGLQLANALKHVISRDFPRKWPGLLDEIKRLLASSEIREVHAGCVAALETVRAFRCAIEQQYIRNLADPTANQIHPEQ